MYLSRIEIPLGNAAAQRLLASPNIQHGTILKAFPHPTGRVLFRLEPTDRFFPHAAVLLVQSDQKPDWRSEPWSPGVEFGVKALDPVFSSGQRLRFRLRANPTYRAGQDCPEEKIRKGQRVAHLTEVEQLAWLSGKGERGGFKLGSVLVVDEKWIECKKRNHVLTFRSVLFEGTLTVADSEKFKETLATGMGSGKAFGFGLLSIARA